MSSLSGRMGGRLLRLYRHHLQERPAVRRLLRSAVARLIPPMERATGFRTMPGDPVWFRLVMLMAAHEVATTAWMKRLVGAGMIACDVGAHIGYHAVRLARLVGQQGSVFAFEPNAETAAVLRLNTSRFGNVTVVDCAVSDFNGEAILLPSGGDTSTHRLGGGIAEEGNLTDRGNRVSVRRLDDWAVEAGLHHIDFVKVDAEGQDAAVCFGAAHLSSRPDERLRSSNARPTSSPRPGPVSKTW